MKLLSCFFFFWLMILVTSGQNVCEPVEEGSSLTLICDVTQIRHFIHHLEWVLEDADGYDTIIATCLRPGFCYRFHQDYFNARINESESVLIIKNVSRIEDFNSEGRWTCAPGIAKDEAVICDLLQVYLKPEKPVCDDPVLSDLQTYVSVTCKTDKVYPQAGCHFLGSWNINRNESTPLEERIYYNHTATDETPVYYKSECTLELPVSSLRDGENFFKVLMYPNVTDGSHFGVESNVVIFNLGSNQDPKGNLEKSESDVDNSTTIGLSVAVVIITIVAVVLGVLMIYYRKKYRNKPNRKMAPSYDEVNKAQSDQVISYEEPTTFDKAAFTMTSPGDVHLQEEIKGQDGVYYEVMEGDPRSQKNAKENTYENQITVKY